MKIIAKKDTFVVIYADADLYLTESGAGNGDWFDSDTTTDNSELFEDVQLPANWCGGDYIYDADLDTWGLTPQGQAKLDAKLADQRASIWEEIKKYRDNLSETGGYLVTVGGASKWFHSDAKSKTQQLGLVLSGANVPPVQWKTMDGTFVQMSQAWAQAIFAAAAAKDVAIFAKAEEHKAAVDASSNPTEYNWKTGWPASFGG